MSKPRSSEVSSPVSIGVLPAISPLASTPIDIPSFDIPEAQKPLPESPVEQSPVTVIVDSNPQSPPIPSTSSLSTSSSQSYITSPQELSEDPATSIETAVTSPVNRPHQLLHQPLSPRNRTHFIVESALRIRAMISWPASPVSLWSHCSSKAFAGLYHPSSCHHEARWPF